MKKLFLGFAAIAMTFTACGGQKSPEFLGYAHRGTAG